MTFTLAHGFAVSLALHGALVLPFVLPAREEPPQEPPLLMVELQGFVSDTQSEQQVQQQTKGQAAQEAQQAAEAAQAAQQAAPDTPQDEPVPEGTTAVAQPPAPEQEAVAAPSATSEAQADTQAGRTGTADVKGADEQKQAQTIAPDPQEEEQRLLAYLQGVAKKAREKLVYPDNPRKTIRARGTTWVSFTVLADGRISPGTLKVRTSSGQPQYDAAALKTVAASAPFDPPPKEMDVAIPVDYAPN